MRDWFAQLSQRERILVLACAVFVVVALVWTLAIRPLFAGTAQLEQQVERKTAQLANLQELAAQYRPGSDPGAAAGGPGDSIVVIIDRTTRQRQLSMYLKRNQPEANGGVRVRFEGAPFDALVTWLGELSDRYGMQVLNASIDESGTAGRVNCTLLLSRPGG